MFQPNPLIPDYILLLSRFNADPHARPDPKDRSSSAPEHWQLLDVMVPERTWELHTFAIGSILYTGN